MSQYSTDSVIYFKFDVQSGEKSIVLAWNTSSIYPHKPTEIQSRSTVQSPLPKMATIQEWLATKPSGSSQQTQYINTVEAYDKWAEVSAYSPISHHLYPIYSNLYRGTM